jgi:calcineurin-like phosphoesterase family protein
MKTKLYWTSDWHIGHKNVLAFDNRPFKDLDEMHTVLIKNFNMFVPDHGITYFLGDMGLCSNGLLKSVIDQLKGTKILVRGNHDGKMDSMYNAGFDVVIDKAQITIGKTIITMSHCPLYDVYRENTFDMKGANGTENWHGEGKHRNKYTFEDFGQAHLHGHIHSPNGGKSQKILGNQYDIGVCANKYKPVSFDTIQSFISNLTSYPI